MKTGLIYSFILLRHQNTGFTDSQICCIWFYTEVKIVCACVLLLSAPRVSIALRLFVLLCAHRVLHTCQYVRPLRCRLSLPDTVHPIHNTHPVLLSLWCCIPCPLTLNITWYVQPWPWPFQSVFQSEDLQICPRSHGVKPVLTKIDLHRLTHIRFKMLEVINEAYRSSDGNDWSDKWTKKRISWHSSESGYHAVQIFHKWIQLSVGERVHAFLREISLIERSTTKP